MKDVDTGGCAFPSELEYQDGTWNQTYDPGMTLRDYFAAHAMQGMMANQWNTNYKDWADHAYQMADAMLARKRKDD